MLATRDPYAAASLFSLAGWRVEAGIREDDGRRRAQVSLARTRVLLVSCDAGRAIEPLSDGTGKGTGAAAALGAGVELHVAVPPAELAKVFLLHRAAGVAVSRLGPQPGSPRGFVAEIVGYRFVIVAGDPEPDLASVPADPRIVRVADALARATAGSDSRPEGPAGARLPDPELLTDTALSLLEASGQTVRRLRTARSRGLIPSARHDVGVDLAEVVIEAAVLARQLGVDLEDQLDHRLQRMAVSGARRQASVSEAAG